LCFEGAVALLADGAVVEYGYFSSNEHARLAADGDTVVGLRQRCARVEVSATAS